jgi:hypothetical protein
MTPAPATPETAAMTCQRRRNTHLPGTIHKRLQITADLIGFRLSRDSRHCGALWLLRALSSSGRVMSPWLAAAPSRLTVGRRRCFGGTVVIAASVTVRWSAVVSGPALPVPSIPAGA